MKKYFVFILVSVVLLFNSCSGDEKNLFKDDSSKRMEKYLKDAYDALVSADNGWVMEYFNVNDPQVETIRDGIYITRGYMFIMKFEKNEVVNIAARHPLNGNVYREGRSLFKVKSENGPELSFDLVVDEPGDFHLLSDPRADGYGYGGDYEFTILEFSNDEFKLRGKKRGTYIYLYKLSNDVVWEKYFEDIYAFQNYVFQDAPNPLVLVSSETKLIANNGISNRFTLNKEGVPPALYQEYAPFLVYPDKIRFQFPFTIDDKTISSFKLSADRHKLICIEDESIYFEGVNACNYLFDNLNDIHKTSRRWKVFREEGKISYTMEDMCHRLDSAIKLISRLGGLKSIFFTFEGSGQSCALGVEPVNGLVAYFYFETVNLGNDKIKFTYSNKNNSQGDTFYNHVLFGKEIKELIEKMSGTYIIAPNPDCNMNLSKIKFTDEKNPEKYCFLTL